MAIGIQRALRFGILGILGAWHVCLVGMVETFSERRLIGESITLGYVLLVALMFFVGYLSARQSERPGEAILAGIVGGGLIGLGLTILAIVTEALNLRSVFVFATRQLVDLLTLELDAGLAATLVPLVVGMVCGALGAAITLLPPLWRRVVATALLATILIGVLRDVLIVVLPDTIEDVFFSSRANSGLTPLGAVLTLIIVGAIAWASAMYRPAQRSARLTTRGGATADAVRFAPMLVLGIVLLTFPIWGKLFLSNVADFVGLYVIMGLGLNLVVGFAGLLDLGFVGFYAIGAYTMAILTSPDLGFFSLTFWEALPFCVLAAMAAGVLLGLPVLRMRGDYLAITTLGFGEIIRILLISDWLKSFTGGAQGLTRIARPEIGSFVINTPETYYYLILAGCLLAWFVGVRLKSSRMGRAWMAIREDEDVAQAMGINRVFAKLTAFAIGAFLGGLSGALFSSMVNSVVPTSFSLLVSINVLALIIVGGMGSLPGVVVGAIVLVGLPELLREFREYRLLVYGVVLVVMMLYRPEGLWPEERRAQELHETEEEPVADEIPAAVPVRE